MMLHPTKAQGLSLVIFTWYHPSSAGIIDKTMSMCPLLIRGSEENHLVKFYKSSLEKDLKVFHTPNSERVKAIFDKY